MSVQDHFFFIRDNKIEKYDSNFKLLKSIEPVDQKYNARQTDQNGDLIAIVYKNGDVNYEYWIVVIRTDLSIFFKTYTYTGTHISHIKLLKDRLYMALTSGSLEVQLFKEKHEWHTHHHHVSVPSHPLESVFITYQKQPYMLLGNRTIDTPDKPTSMHLLPDLTEIKVPFQLVTDRNLHMYTQSLGLTDRICQRDYNYKNGKEQFHIISTDKTQVIDNLNITSRYETNYCYDPFTDTLIVTNINIKDKKIVVHLLTEQDAEWKLVKTKKYDYETDYKDKYHWVEISCTHNHIIIRYVDGVIIIDKFTLEKVHRFTEYAWVFSDNNKLSCLPQLLLTDPSLSKLADALIRLILSYLLQE